jgi:hypothetical protein
MVISRKAQLLAVWKKNAVVLSLAFFAAFAGVLLSLLSPPPALQHYHVRNVTMERVLGWAARSSPFSYHPADELCGDGKAQVVVLSADNAATISAAGQPSSFDLICRQPTLAPEAFVTLAVVFIALLAMIANQPPDVCMLGATLVLLVWPWTASDGNGILSESAAFQGFANAGVLTVGVLFVVARAVNETGIVRSLMASILGGLVTLQFTIYSG